MAAASQEGGFKGLMDTVIRKKLGIIPKDVSYVITTLLAFPTATIALFIDHNPDDAAALL
jgi:hypothetical protein